MKFLLTELTNFRDELITHVRKGKKKAISGEMAFCFFFQPRGLDQLYVDRIDSFLSSFGFKFDFVIFSDLIDESGLVDEYVFT